jgi:hypothetical protein
MKVMTIALSGLAIAMPGPAAAADQEPRDATIPFVNHGNLDDFRADGDSAVYLRATGRQWYRATLLGPCTELPFAQAIGVETRGIDTLDKFSTLIVRGQRCQLQSLVKSGPPPKKSRS